MEKAAAEARIGSQADRETRLAGADVVIDNSSDHDHLRAEVERAWTALLVLRAQQSRLPAADG
jgi:dephospho-CoA kinase